MNRERMPAKICKFVEIFLPVDLFSSPAKKKFLHCGQTGTHFVQAQKTDLLIEAVPFFPSTQARHSEKSLEH